MYRSTVFTIGFICTERVRMYLVKETNNYPKWEVEEAGWSKDVKLKDIFYSKEMAQEEADRRNNGAKGIYK